MLLTERAFNQFALGVPSCWTCYRQPTLSMNGEKYMKPRFRGSLAHRFAPSGSCQAVEWPRPYAEQSPNNADVSCTVCSRSNSLLFDNGAKNPFQCRHPRNRRWKLADDIQNSSRRITQKNAATCSSFRGSYRSDEEVHYREPKHWKEKLSEDSSNRAKRFGAGESDTAGKGKYRDNKPSEGEGNPKSWSSKERKEKFSSHTKTENGRIRGDRMNRISSGMSENKYDSRNGTGVPENIPGRRRIKEPKVKPQVQFSSAMSKDPHIGIIGGGIAGLMCAVTLEKHGIRSTVFDTGKHGLGGRLATRHVDMHGGVPLMFDHAAQFFTVSDPEFKCFVEQWISEGIVKEWSGVIGTLRLGHFVKYPECTKYVGVHGMRSLADRIASQGKLITVKRPCWISDMYACDERWHLVANGQSQGYYDAVVIAHNGKCANNLLAPAGVPLVAKQMKRLELSSIWALLAAFEERIPLPEQIEGACQLDGAFVEGVDSVSWIANNTIKLCPSSVESPHCWTFLSTATYGQKNKVPQESIPNARVNRVTREMLHGVELALGLAKGSLPDPFYSRVQLWGAALPKNCPNEPCIFDPSGRVGICGDWLLGSSMEAATLSGMALANHISKFRDSREVCDVRFERGLHSSFTNIVGHDIGQFPDCSKLQALKLEAPMAV